MHIESFSVVRARGESSTRRAIRAIESFETGASRCVAGPTGRPIACASHRNGAACRRQSFTRVRNSAKQRIIVQ
ncbi:hypothetical protein BURMUCF2_A1053 [Burkholderia multivorans CF2]|nr:hypothetical protein BURMUCF2_A1053 [Burkholderia multivorans CF2]